MGPMLTDGRMAWRELTSFAFILAQGGETIKNRAAIRVGL